ncbi:hypothetical protein [Bacillus sp. JJ1474]|uniref:hypothetical protein n=1 Tax=Bacillus sp. JJ1474 TaxID=3122955 RepID=UPI002FFE7A2C
MNLELAKKRLAKLQNFIELTESYKAETIEQKIILEYAISSSMSKVRWKMKKLGHDVEIKDISEIIRSKPMDELHKIVRGFLKAKSPKKDEDIW